MGYHLSNGYIHLYALVHQAMLYMANEQEDAPLNQRTQEGKFFPICKE